VIKRGFTKGFSLGPPNLRGPKISGVKQIPAILQAINIFIFVLVQCTFFYYAANNRSVQNRVSKLFHPKAT